MEQSIDLSTGDESARLQPDLMADLRGPLRTLLMAAPHVVYAADRHGRLQWLNPAFETITGRRITDWLGRPYLPLFHTDDRALMRDRFARLIEGDSIPPREARIIREDGRLVVGDFMGVAHFEGGHMRLALGIMRDVTAKREIDDALSRSEARYRNLVQRNVAGITLTGSDTRFVDVNDAAARMLGFARREDVIGLSAEDFYDNPEDRRVVMRQLERDGHVAHMEFPLRRRDGSRFWVVGSASLLDDPSRVERVQSAVIDVTERKALEEQLRHAQKMDAIGRLAGGIAHDFNNILMAIVVNCDMLERRLAKGIAPLDAVASIRGAAERARRLTSQLLSMSRREPAAACVIDVNHIAGRSLEFLERLLGTTITIDLRLSAGPLPVYADPSHLEQILMNLVVNARDAMPDGGRIAISTSRRAYAPAPGAPSVPHVAIEVADSGIGMDERTRARMFEPFFTTKPRGEGTGLGLAIVYGIVRQHGGHVTVTSAPGAGTVMTVMLPARDEIPQTGG